MRNGPMRWSAVVVMLSGALTAHADQERLVPSVPPVAAAPRPIGAEPATGEATRLGAE